MDEYIHQFPAIREVLIHRKFSEFEFLKEIQTEFDEVVNKAIKENVE